MFEFNLFSNGQQEETMQQAQPVASIASEPPQIEKNPNAIDVTMIQQVAGSSAPFFRTKMLATIDAVEEYSWTRGEQGGLDWGFESMNKAFEGLNTGVFLVAGQSNIGMS